MGVLSNVEGFLSEKHATDQKIDNDSTLFQEKLITETLDKDCVAPTQQPQQLVQKLDQKQQSQKLHECLKLRLESPVYKNDEEDLFEGFKTPTSEEYKTPTILECPPPPRKRKMLSSTDEIGDCLFRVLDFTELSMVVDVAVTNKKPKNLYMEA